MKVHCDTLYLTKIKKYIMENVKIITNFIIEGRGGRWVYLCSISNQFPHPPKKKKKKFNWAGLWPNTLHAARCHGLIWA